MPRFSLTQLRFQLQSYRQYRRSRRQLLALEDRLLEDIGISRTQALKEGRKSFWQQTAFKRGPDESR
ncbi:DUF1127 domain-containing protein [Vreelandella maris]|uniref:DUF1127 domain-containing protein n=1 Tax=Vreelandella maris TaxID=2729617 RepID=A0A7Y6V9P6_9GAMM|nr:DUF1127 domain-containing protein [Halomonas maris]NVF15105.1 DUF1127 domain-containing protein [Halomonas maris]|tara:strand:+ start:116 stop:316 length:201 start_codon:yes stop_codon:yes gene_type:complete